MTSFSRLYITFHPWCFGPTEWRSYEVTSVHFSLELLLKIFIISFFYFFLREVRVSSNLKSDSRNFVKTSFSWGFWAKMDQNEVFLVLQKTQCVEFFWFFCLKLQQSAFWEKSCFKSSKWDFQVLWKIVSQNVPDFFCKVTIENKLKIDLSDFFARKILFSRFLGKSGPINDPEWFFS